MSQSHAEVTDIGSMPPRLSVSGSIRGDEPRFSSSSSAPPPVLSLAIPLDVALLIMEESNLEERLIMMRVSSTWRDLILNQWKLWRDLSVDLADGDKAVQKALLHLQRSRGRIHCLRIKISYFFGTFLAEQRHTDLAAQKLFQRTLASVLNLVTFDLRNVSLDLQAYDRLSDFWEERASLFKYWTIYLHSKCAGLVELECFNQPEDVSPTGFLRVFPTLRRLTLTLHDSEDYDDDWNPNSQSDTWVRRLPAPASNQLTHFIACCTNISGKPSPILPHLTNLALYNLRVSGLRKLILGCASVLQHLKLGAISDPDDSHRRPGAYVDKLVLPKLSTFHISLPVPLALTEKLLPGAPTFSIKAPNLVAASFAPILYSAPSDSISARALNVVQDILNLCRERDAYDSGEKEVEDPDLMEVRLKNLFHSSPNLEELDLRGCNLTYGCCFNALTQAPPSLRSVSLPRDTAEKTIELLPSLLLNLQAVRLDDDQECLPVLAPMCDLILKRAETRQGYPFTVYINQSKMRISSEMADRLKKIFLEALAQIEEVQFEDLLEDFSLYTTPGGNTIQSLKTEILEMVRERLLIGKTAWNTTVSDPTASDSTKGNDCKNDKGGLKLAMWEWLQAREIVLAREWFKKAEKVGVSLIYSRELEWGYVNFCD